MLSPPARRSLERKRNRVHLPCRMPKGNLAARRLRSGRGYYRRFTRGKKEKNTIRGGGAPRRGRGGWGSAGGWLDAAEPRRYSTSVVRAHAGARGTRAERAA